MTGQPSHDWSDAQLVEYIHKWSTERWNCGLDSHRATRIDKEHLAPCAAMLEKRGATALAKLLPLLDDDNPQVRILAACFAYKVNAAACRKTLEDLMKTPDIVGVLAWTALSSKDPSIVPSPCELWGKHF